ncbi:MAG TPA: ABC transporter ATP-binding protein [Rhizobiaceae bacterium]|nr:ABC transporter ATP-binding protein [Rhizobiaceae bacterium]
MPAVRGVSFDVEQGKCLGIVGESGSGKSVTSLALMGLLPPGRASLVEGEIRFAGRDLRKLAPAKMRRLCGSELAMVFQEPMTSLNPAFTVGDQIMEVVMTHEGVPARIARARALELLREVRIAAPERRLDDYPHSMSGGMRQRVMIAIALACRPRLLIADEPTTALDVTVQAQIMELLRVLQGEYGMSIILISHNLGVISEIADDIAVMYAGRIVERSSAQRLFDQPEHPYTVGLLGAIPSPGRERLASIKGRVPDLNALPSGCTFEPRCPFAEQKCREIDPALAPVEPGHFSACLRAPLEQLT